MQKLGDAFLHNLLQSFSQLQQELSRFELATKQKKPVGPELGVFTARVTQLDQKFQSLGFAANFLTGTVQTEDGWRPNPALLEQLRKTMDDVGTILGRLTPSDPRERGKGSLAKQVEKALEQRKEMAKTAKTLTLSPRPALERVDAPTPAGEPMVGVVLMAAIVIDMLKTWLAGPARGK